MSRVAVDAVAVEPAKLSEKLDRREILVGQNEAPASCGGYGGTLGWFVLWLVLSFAYSYLLALLFSAHG